jgi:hypothetical protein
MIIIYPFKWFFGYSHINLGGSLSYQKCYTFLIEWTISKRF